MSNILITSRIIGTVIKEPIKLLKEAGHNIVSNPYLGQNVTEEQIIDLIREVDGMIVGDDHITRNVIKNAKNLKVISKNGVGVDRIDLKAATEYGVIVTNTPGANAEAVADLTFGLMLCVARQIHVADRLTKEGNFERVVGVEVWNKTIGIVGTGKIGKAVAKRAKGFNMQLLGYDIIPDNKFAQEIGLKYVSLKNLLEQSDFVTLHAPSTDQSRSMINKNTISLMKPNGYIINVARGDLIVTDDLYDALKKGKIAGAAIDVWEEEPPVGNPLLTINSVVTTSHIGAFSKEAMINQCIMSTKNLIKVLNREIPKENIVNSEVLEEVSE